MCFDSGDEWVLRCKRLRVLDERCDLPHKGDAPQQYAIDREEDSEEMEFPELFSKVELKCAIAR